jgi:hypothetical protein
MKKTGVQQRCRAHCHTSRNALFVIILNEEFYVAIDQNANHSQKKPLFPDISQARCNQAKFLFSEHVF